MAASPRITGLYGALFIHAATAPALASVRKVADTFNLQFESSVEMLPVSRKGEGFGRFMPGGGSARITGDAHFQKLATMASYADDDLFIPGTPPAAATPYIRIAFKLAVNDGDLAADEVWANSTNLPALDLAQAGLTIIQGFGWMASAQLLLPHDDAITQPFEIQVDGQWELAVST